MTDQPKLTGKLRFQITKEWMKRGLEGDPETFIRKVCLAKGIQYVRKEHQEPPKSIEVVKEVQQQG